MFFVHKMTYLIMCTLVSTRVLTYLRDSPDSLTFAKPFCEDSPDSPTFAKPFYVDSPDSPTFSKPFCADSPNLRTASASTRAFTSTRQALFCEYSCKSASVARVA